MTCRIDSKNLIKNYPHADIFNIITELEESDRLLSQNVQPQLVLVNLSIKLRTLLT